MIFLPLNHIQKHGVEKNDGREETLGIPACLFTEIKAKPDKMKL